MRRFALAFCAVVVSLLVFAASGLKSADTKWPEELKGHIAAPDHHKIRFENRFVRVLEVIISAGDTVPFHLHDLPTVMIVLSPARLETRAANGALLNASRRAQFAAGSHIHVRWLDPQVPGAIVKNIDTVKFVGVRVELKIPFVN